MFRQSSASWPTPNQSTLSRFKQVENTNYVVELTNQNRMHFLAIQSADIIDAFKTLVLRLAINETCPHRDGPTQPHKKANLVLKKNGNTEKSLRIELQNHRFES
ncbi:uncharacterized protein BJ212DRAFT_1295826 [Suillus subaureus]|uniref:Uncharacterized protein n=1 Tax=Suillus subaureus TaxID=48587 RepID=A0A9P7JIC5_9AGAM|nr:uncharacterized protein BJ212DRAFT_1295826 [Suillus subaureus]KAG1824724.1 hypothetical protein BJ212DRAFT_1295826 [Suillus subaureus]